jgi:hypothetical protein
MVPRSVMMERVLPDSTSHHTPRRYWTSWKTRQYRESWLRQGIARRLMNSSGSWRISSNISGAGINNEKKYTGNSTRPPRRNSRSC